jgi:hypothetical protein
MLFARNNRRTESKIVPILPAASREAGRVVTTSQAPLTPAQRKSGLISAAREAASASSGVRNAVSPAIVGAPTQVMPAVGRSGVKTQVMPAVGRSGVKGDGRNIAICLLFGLLVLNVMATALLLWNMDRQDPELIAQKVRLELAIEEFDKMKLVTKKFIREFESRAESFQEEFDNARGQWQLIDARARNSVKPLDAPRAYNADVNSGAVGFHK